MNEQQTRIFLDRYARRDAQGNILETHPDQTFRRVAQAVASIDRDRMHVTEEQLFFEEMRSLRFIPGGRILAGAGTGNDVTLYNCFVIPSPEDSRGGIIENLKLMTEIMARGGGVGVNLSSLRPRGSHIKTVNGTASGPVSWAELYSVATGDVICQGGSRRGALMLMLDDDHPDILEFVNAKRKNGKLQYANISVAVSDKFITAVEQDATWDLKWGNKIYATVAARSIWNELIQSSWESGDPGLVFMERVRDQGNTSYFEELIAVNPCGEQPLPAYGVCNLGSINLAAFVEDGEINFRALANTVSVAVCFLDRVIDLTYSFMPENKLAQEASRRVGLGTMGLADALIKMGIRYGSERSLEMIDLIYGQIRDTAYMTSAQLAQERGPFMSYRAKEYLARPFVQALPSSVRAEVAMWGIRNATLLTQAPTGTTSLLVGVSNGIEPVFSLETVRADRTGTHVMKHPLYQEWREAHPDEPVPDYFVTAMDLSPEEHIAVQARIQRYTDASISKTINLPSSATIEDVNRAFLLAYQSGCKGITVFRDGCKEGVLTAVPTQPMPEPAQETKNVPEKRELGPLHGSTYKILYPFGGQRASLFVTVNGNGKPQEVFINGQGNQTEIAALGWTLSQLLRWGKSAEEIVENFWEFQGVGAVWNPGVHRPITCIANAVASALEQWLGRDERPEQSDDPPDDGAACPQCHANSLVREAGCKVCKRCGYSACG